MKAVYKVLFMLTIIAAGFTNLYAQSDKVLIKLSQPPPNQMGVGDMWNLELTNTTDKEINIYLTGTATEEKDGLIIEGKSKVFTVKPGRSNYKYNDFSSAEVKYNNGKYKEIILRTGNAPEGSYTICVTAFDESGTEVGRENCISQTVQQMGGITLLTPGDGEEIDPDTLPGLMFTWTPLPKGGPYSLRIVELKGSESKEEGISANRPIIDKEKISISSYQLGSTDAKLETGKKYAWQVTGGSTLSEVYFFKIKSISEDTSSTIKEYLIIKSDNQEIEYSYITHSTAWTKANPPHPDPVEPGLKKKHEELTSITHPWDKLRPKLLQSDSDNMDYSEITLQALDGTEVGLKFVHASSDSSYSVSSWVIPEKIGINKENEVEEQIAGHFFIKSYIHSIPNTECWNMPGGRKFRIINNGDNNKEGIVTYELKENGKYGFKLFSNLITQEDLDKIKNSDIILLDLNDGIKKIRPHNETWSTLLSHLYLDSKWHGADDVTPNISDIEYLIIKSKDNTELDNLYVTHYSSSSVIHNFQQSVTDPFIMSHVWSYSHKAYVSTFISTEKDKARIKQSDLDNLDFSNITLEALDGAEVGLKFVHASSDSSYSVSSWILPEKTGFYNQDEMKEHIVHLFGISIKHTIFDSFRDNIGRKYRLTNNVNNDKEGIVTFELKENGKYGFKLFNYMISKEELEKIKYSEIMLLDLKNASYVRHCYLYTKCDGPSKPKEK